MLAVPYLTAAAVAGEWNSPLLLAAACALAVFLLRGSLDARACAEGIRGSGWKKLSEPAHLLLAAIALLAAGGLLLGYERWALVPLGAGALLLDLLQTKVAARHEQNPTEKRSLAAELLGVVLLSFSAPVPWLAARNMLEAAALHIWALNLVFFLGGVLYVKYRVRGLYSHRAFRTVGGRISFAAPVLLYHALLFAFLLVFILWGIFPAVVLLAFAPAIFRAGALVAQLGRRFPIRRLGWMEVIHSLVFATHLVLALR